MNIDVSGLLNGSSKPIKFNYTLNLEDLVYSTYNPVKKGAKIKGSVYEKAGVVYLDADISFKFFGFCDRCAEEIVKDMGFKLSKILVSKLANDADADFDDYVVVSNGVLELDDLVTEDIQLFLPSKMLCKPDCKGLCYKCGKNLNFGDCDCKKDVDPRMEALLQLLDE